MPQEECHGRSVVLNPLPKPFDNGATRRIDIRIEVSLANFIL
jgi:hypothetical protein